MAFYSNKDNETKDTNDADNTGTKTTENNSNCLNSTDNNSLLTNTNETQDVTSLETAFMYQNSKTGNVSSTSLSIRQLCRILCPSNGASNNNIINQNTLIIQYDSTSNTYSSRGWQPSNKTPILKECCSQWYYISSNDNHSSNGIKIEGPVSCRVLSKLLKVDGIITLQTKVFSHDVNICDDNQQKQQQQWCPIIELPYLQSAIDAFETSIPPWSNTVVGKIGNEKEENVENKTKNKGIEKDIVEDELEAFLSSTTGDNDRHLGVDDEDEETYESDGGTVYYKCPQTGNWIHEKAMASTLRNNKQNIQQQQKKNSVDNNQNKSIISAVNNKKRKKKNKPKFSAKNAKNWIYVTGLPTDCTFDEVNKFFSRVGIIDLDIETQKPKIKIYKHKEGPQMNQPKGDCSICYARHESVDLAINILDETSFRPSVTDTSSNIVRVQRAKFEQHGTEFDASKKSRISLAKQKVAKLAAIQALDWQDEKTDGASNNRLSGGRKGLCIIVLKNMFTLDELSCKKSSKKTNEQQKATSSNNKHNADDGEEDDDTVIRQIESNVHKECEQYGNVEKITIFSKNPNGIIIVKFASPAAASNAIKAYDGKVVTPIKQQQIQTSSAVGQQRKIEASFWDGVTDYTIRDEEKLQQEENKRQDVFGSWLDNQEIPEELRLRVEGE